MRGAADDIQLRAGDGSGGAGALPGRCGGVFCACDDEGGRFDGWEERDQVHASDGLAAAGVAFGVSAFEHVHDGGYGGGLTCDERGREPAGHDHIHDGGHTSGAHLCYAFGPGLPGWQGLDSGAADGQGADALGGVGGEPQADHAADGDAAVGGASDAVLVEQA